MRSLVWGVPRAQYRVCARRLGSVASDMLDNAYPCSRVGCTRRLICFSSSTRAYLISYFSQPSLSRAVFDLRQMLAGIWLETACIRLLFLLCLIACIVLCLLACISFSVSSHLHACEQPFAALLTLLSPASHPTIPPTFILHLTCCLATSLSLSHYLLIFALLPSLPHALSLPV